MKLIGYYDDAGGLGGTSRYLLELVRGLDRSRFQPVFFAPVRLPWHDMLEELAVEVITAAAPPSGATIVAAQRQLPLLAPTHQPLRGLRGLKANLAWRLGLRKDIAALTRLFRTRPVDLLHSNNTGEEAAPIAARRAGIPWVAGTLHVGPDYDLFGEHRESRHLNLQKRSMKSLHLAIGVSRRTVEDWQDHLRLPTDQAPKTKVVYNGIAASALTPRRSRAEAKLALGLPGDSLVIGSLGRLDYAKGYGDLLAALPAVFEKHPQARMIHAGGGPLANALLTEAARLGIADRISWIGFRSDVRDLLEATDIYVQPSWCEAHPLAILEAGAFGLPVVASDVGGVAESLDGGKAGWLVLPRSPKGLTEVLLSIIENPAEMAARGRVLSERVRSIYTREAMCSATQACYETLLGAGGVK